MLIGESKDRVFAKKSAERRATNQCQRAGRKCAKRDFKLWREAAHFPNVLLVMQADDDGAGGKEQERFEKCVREKVKHRRFVRGESDGHHHVTELRDRGVS